MGVTYDGSTGLFLDDQTGNAVGYNPDFQPTNSPISSQQAASDDQYVSTVVWIASVSLFSANPGWPTSPNGQTFDGVLVGDLRANGSQVVNPAGQTQTIDLSGFADTDRVLVTWQPRYLPS